MRPTAALYAGIEAGLTHDGDEEPGQVAGDEIMTIASERGIDGDPMDLLGQANHLAALADIIVYVLRSGKAWERPGDVEIGQAPWRSGAFLNATRTRLRRVALIDRWSPEREESEAASWRSRGEALAYGMPIDQIGVVIGQNRKGRWSSPWTKAWLHPINRELRMQKRSGETFGGRWQPVFREQVDIPREKWIEVMAKDGVMTECLYETRIEPEKNFETDQVAMLLRAKMEEVHMRSSAVRSLSQCYWPVPCPFSEVCPHFVEPSTKNGFTKIQGNAA